MHRRTFLTGTAVAVPLIANPARIWAQATPSDSPPSFPSLELTLSDTGFEIASTFATGRYSVTTTNSGSSASSHSVVARLPEGMTSDEFDVVNSSEDGAGFDFGTIMGLGFPDWPLPGASVSGIADLLPGLHVVFDPFGSRASAYFDVTNGTAEFTEPNADLEFTIGEMIINLPKGPILGGPATWKVSNLGALTHELAVLQVPQGFTFDDLMALFMLPEDATPTPDMKVVDYQPIAAIGLLGAQSTSWLNVDLKAASHYMALCMFPDDQGIPHTMSGMYAFFDIA